MQECLSAWVHQWSLLKTKHFRFNWHVPCAGIILRLSFEQCCLQTLITSTYRCRGCRGPVRGTWTGRDVDSLLSRHWEPQKAWRHNNWPFLRRTLCSVPVGFGWKNFLCLFRRAQFSHVYPVSTCMENKVMNSLCSAPPERGQTEKTRLRRSSL